MADVLLVSRESLVRERTEAILTAGGITLQTAERCPDLLGTLALDPPRLLLLDAAFLEQEGVDAQAMLSDLRTRHPVDRLPILALAAGEPETRAPLLEFGVEDLISLPIDAPALLAKVRLHLEVAGLRQELAERNIQLETMNQRLAHLVELKDRFLALATHDIRTPITTMKLGLDVLEHRLEASARLGAQRPLDILARNLARIESKIDEFLLIARLDLRRVQLDWDWVELMVYVEDAVASFFPGAISREVSLDAEIAPIPLFRGDGRRLEQMVCEILGTLMERIEPGHRVLVRLREGSGAGSEATAILELSADSPPFPPEQAAALREGLAREEPTGETRASLYAAHRIAEAHGGQLHIDGLGEAGVRVLVILPLRQHDDDETERIGR